jgi:hypothetical protein
MNWHDGRQNRCGFLRYGYRSPRARYLGRGVKNNLSGGREQRCSFESIAVIMIKRVIAIRARGMVRTRRSEEVDLADAGHTVVRCMETKQKVQRTQR